MNEIKVPHCEVKHYCEECNDKQCGGSPKGYCVTIKYCEECGECQ